MNRWPPLLFVLALVAGLIVLDRWNDPAEEAVALVEQEQGPVAAPADASGSTAYCAAGFATPDGANDHIVIMTNRTDVEAVGMLTVYPSLLDTLGNPVPFERAVQPVQVRAGAQQRVSLALLLGSLDSQLATNTGAFVAALVEFEGGGVTVEHEVIAVQGRSMGPCSTSAGTSWWFASGTTTADVRYQLYLLNPFPDDAVVDVTFVTDAGTRSPTGLRGKLVPAQSLTVLQISPLVPVNEQMTAQVTAVAGRVIAERIQLFENEAGPRGLSLALGANRMSEQWFFPAGHSIAGSGESYMIYNPNEEPAVVEFELKPDRGEGVEDGARIEVDIAAQERWIVTVADHSSHPANAVSTIDATGIIEPGAKFFATVRSFNGVPVVVERIISRPVEAGGITATLGADLAALDQTVSLSGVFATSGTDEIDATGPGDAPAGTLAILNAAADTISRVQVLVGGSSGEEVRAEVEIAPRRRASFDLAALLEPGDGWIRVISSTATVAEITVVAGPLLLSAPAVPVQGTTEVPDLLSFD